MRKLSLLLLIPFSVLTLYALLDVGYLGIFEYQVHSSAGWQVFADLVVALILVICWLIKDAKTHGRTVWPWIVATLFLGSIAPLLYFAVQPGAAKNDQTVSAV